MRMSRVTSRPMPLLFMYFEATEVEDEGTSGGRVGLGIRLHEYRFGESGNIALDINDGGVRRHLAHCHLHVGVVWHWFSPHHSLFSSSHLFSSSQENTHIEAHTSRRSHSMAPRFPDVRQSGATGITPRSRTICLAASPMTAANVG